MKKTITIEVKMTPEDIQAAIKEYLQKTFDFKAENIKFNARLENTSDDGWSRAPAYDAIFEGATCTVIQITDK